MYHLAHWVVSCFHCPTKIILSYFLCDFCLDLRNPIQTCFSKETLQECIGALGTIASSNSSPHQGWALGILQQINKVDKDLLQV